MAFSPRTARGVSGTFLPNFAFSWRSQLPMIRLLLVVGSVSAFQHRPRFGAPTELVATTSAPRLLAARTVMEMPAPDVGGSANRKSAPAVQFAWTPLVVLKVAALFIIAGLAEIGGGWLVWQAVREGKPKWWAAAGSLTLVLYGFIPTLQPLPDFGRLYAVYGGLFIAMSYGWGYVFDGMKPDLGDLIGSILALLGVCIALFWPRSASR